MVQALLEKVEESKPAVKRGQVGRPWKYDRLILTLEDDVLYSPGSVVWKGRVDGFFDYRLESRERRITQAEIRHEARKALGSLSHFTAKLPDTPEGYTQGRVRRDPNPAWYGKTWKEALFNSPRFSLNLEK